MANNPKYGNTYKMSSEFETQPKSLQAGYIQSTKDTYHSPAVGRANMTTVVSTIFNLLNMLKKDLNQSFNECWIYIVWII